MNISFFTVTAYILRLTIVNLSMINVYENMFGNPVGF